MSHAGGHLGDTGIFVPPYHTQYGSTHIKEEPFTYEDESLIYSHKYKLPGPIEQYTSTDIKEESAVYEEHLVDQVHVHRTPTRIEEEEVSCDRGDIYTPECSSTGVKEEPDSCDQGNIIYPTSKRRAARGQQYHRAPVKEELSDCGNPTIYTQYTLPHIKAEPRSYEEEDLPNTYSPTDHRPRYGSPHIKVEGVSRDVRNTIDHTRYPSTDYAQSPSADIKEEPDACHQANLIDPMTSTAADRTLHYPSPHVKEEPCDIDNLPSDDAQHYPSARIKEEPVSDVENIEIHTRKISSSFEDEETDSCDEEMCTTKKQAPVKVGIERVNRDIGAQQNIMGYSQHGDCPAPTFQQNAQSMDLTLKCLECEACFTSKSEFEEHLALHRGKKTHVCSHCGKRFSYQSQLLIHERTHTGEKPFTCSECGKCFNQYVHLAIHLMSHTGEKPYVCSECGKSFNRKTTLTIHQRIHTGEKPFHCSQCGKYFSTSSNLIKHQRVHTGEKPYSCSECGELFVHYTQLIRHQANHMTEKPFSCLECGKSFSQKAQFLRHEKFHKADNTYSCSECNQSFKQYKDLLVHQSNHTGQNPFKCRECGKQFDKKWTLVSHQRFHKGEKPFPCSECGKSFGLSSNLAKHIQVHVKEKSCREGGEALAHEARLEEHKVGGSGEETWSCPVCGSQFTEKIGLVDHMMSHR